MLRVLVITYYWPPAGGAGVQRWLKLCKYLPENGVMPTVITVDPDKATYPQRDESMLGEVHPDIEVIRTDSFEPLSWYGRLVGKKNVPYGGFANVSSKGLLSKLSRFIRGNFFIPDARKGWNKFAYRAAKKVISEKNIDVVITTGPPHSTHLVGLRLKKELGVKWVADFRDPWTDIYYNDLMMRTSATEKKDQLLEKEVLDSADNVVANCNSNAELLRDKGGSAAVQVIENGFDPTDYEDVELNKPEQFKIIYTGTMAASYKPRVFLKAMKALIDEHPNQVRWHIAGNIDPEIIRQIEEEGLRGHCEFHGYLPHNEVLKLLMSGQVLLNVFPETRNDRGIPGKLFEYLGARRTILNIGPTDGDAAQIISDCESGATFSREDEGPVTDFLHKSFNVWISGEKNIVENDAAFKYSRQYLSSRYARIVSQF